jgi:hypothetical protein
MRFYNLLYIRKWTKMFVPVSTFFIQLGEKNISFYFYHDTFNPSRINLYNRRIDENFFFLLFLSYLSSTLYFFNVETISQNDIIRIIIYYFR